MTKPELASLSLMAASFLLVSGAVASACAPDFIEVKAENGKFRFKVDVADDAMERSQGLMHVEQMDQFKGMLFVYERPLSANFWMKNTLIPLDMLFADPTGTITRVHENAVPLSEETIEGGSNILYVLEINGGLSEKFGIDEGDLLRHPIIDQSIAAWACPE